MRRHRGRRSRGPFTRLPCTLSNGNSSADPADPATAASLTLTPDESMGHEASSGTPSANRVRPRRLHARCAGDCGSNGVFGVTCPPWGWAGRGAVMTATLDIVAKKKEPVEESAELAAARELVRQAKEQGLSLTGPGGLLKQLTKTVLEAALDEELTEHLGHERRAPAAGANVRNGTCSETVLTESSGHVEIDVPRDRAGSFEPQIVRKRQRRLSGSTRSCCRSTEGAHHRGDLSALRRHLSGVGLEGGGVADHRTGCSRRWSTGWSARSTRSTRRSSSTPLWSRSVTGRSPTGRSTPPSA